MSKNMQSDTNECKRCDSDDQLRTEQRPWNIEEQSLNEIVYDKKQLLVDRANNTFQELCKTLENEQMKLFELEERRKKLQEEMLRLKAEIEEEKQSFNSNIVQSVAENLSALNSASINSSDNVCDQSHKVEDTLKIKNLYTCYDEGEGPQPVTARNLPARNSQEIMKEEIAIDEHVQYIRSELQNVLTQCISEKSSE